jgi:hypothetical protein
MLKIIRFCGEFARKRRKTTFGKWIMKKHIRNMIDDGYNLTNSSADTLIYWDRIYTAYLRIRRIKVSDTIANTNYSYLQKLRLEVLDTIASKAMAPENRDPVDMENRKDFLGSAELSWNKKYIENQVMSFIEVRNFYQYYIDFLNAGKDDDGKELAKRLGMEWTPDFYKNELFLYFKAGDDKMDGSYCIHKAEEVINRD